MNQIRIDPLAAQASAALSRSTGTPPADPTDAFSQVLDQQLADAKDRNAAATDTTRGQSESNASTGGSGRRSNSTWRGSARHRDATQSQPAARPTAKAAPQVPPKTPRTNQTASAAAEPSAPGQKPSADPSGSATPTNPKPAANAPVPATGAKSDADASANKATSQPPADDAASATTTPAQTVNLTAGTTPQLAVPTLLPLQIVAVSPSDGTDLLTGKGGNDAALQLLEGKLLAQQQLDLSALGAATSPAATGDKSSGLSFGAVIAAGAQASLPAGIAAAATKASGAPGTDAGATGSDPFDPQSQDPAAQNPPAQVPGAQNPRSLTTATRGAATNAKPKDSDTAATSPVTAATSQARSPSVVPPVSPSFAPAWTGSGSSSGSDAYGSASGYGGTASVDTDFSTLSQYLGANAAEGLASGVNARQGAFIAQLKQNLQILPPNEQIAVQIQNAMQKGSTRLTVDLHPAELGRVEVKLNVDKDKNVTAQVVVDRPATLDLLQKDAQTLERALQDAGLQTSSGSLSFNLRDTGGQGAGAQQNGGGGQAGAGSGSSAAAADTARVAAADIVATADGYVDLKT